MALVASTNALPDRITEKANSRIVNLISFGFHDGYPTAFDSLTSIASNKTLYPGTRSVACDQLEKIIASIEITPNGSFKTKGDFKKLLILATNRDLGGKVKQQANNKLLELTPRMGLFAAKKIDSCNELDDKVRGKAADRLNELERPTRLAVWLFA